MARLLKIGAPALTIALAAAPAFAQQEPTVQRGRAFVQANCARCHAIDKVSPSPLAIAPPFRDLHRRYPIENLQEAFAEGIVSGHPTMPEFRLDPGQIADVIAFFANSNSGAATAAPAPRAGHHPKAFDVFVTPQVDTVLNFAFLARLAMSELKQMPATERAATAPASREQRLAMLLDAIDGGGALIERPMPALAKRA